MELEYNSSRNKLVISDIIYSFNRFKARVMTIRHKQLYRNKDIKKFFIV